MKHMYAFHYRSVWLYMIVLGLVFFSNLSALAQQGAAVETGVLRIKVTEDLAQALERAQIRKSSANVVITGIQSLDRAALQFRATGIKRVFRAAGKFEAKHRRYGLHRWYEVQLDPTVPVQSAIAAYRGIEKIEYAEAVHKKQIIGSDKPNFGPVRVDPNTLARATLPGPSNDPLLASQWHYNNTGQAGGTPGADISLFEAWGIETGSSNVIVAVTDGGAQVNHPDLAANMWVNVDEVPGNGVDDDNNGYVDDINGYGFGDDTGTIAPSDHGSHTSGTIAATTNNGVGVAGVAGGSGTGDGVRIMTLAAFGATANGGFEDTYVYGADNGAVISQNSWGYTQPDAFDQVVLDGIDYFIAEAGRDENGNQVGPMNGGIVIFAAGNDNQNLNWYPGFYAPTLAVSGLNNQDKKSWYTNFGAWVDIAAPGGETFFDNDPKGVLSTVSGGGYAFFQGTSMACPHVAGVAALLVSKFGGPGFTPQIVRDRLTQFVDPIDQLNPNFAGLLGSGRLNALLALQFSDDVAPEAIDDLAVQSTAITSITLTWTAPADSGNHSATLYDIRYSTAPITEANFEAATAVSNPPTPALTDSTEVFTVTGLQPGTHYYFAIKSEDFFGNTSPLSNVAEGTTNLPPDIFVASTAITVDLQTAGTTERTLVVFNQGSGPLDFTIALPDAPGFASASPLAGSVAPGDSTFITVGFNAANLLAGTYQESLLVLSNDPDEDTVTVSLTLNVTNNGAPIAAVEPDSVDFGPVFETGSAQRTVQITNAGSEPLIITSITSSNPDFTVSASDTVIVPPFRSYTVTITYEPSGLGPAAGELTIVTNDPAQTTFTVWLFGEGVEAPGIAVAPTSLSETLNTDKTSTQTLTVTNTGASDLIFAIEVTGSAPDTARTVKTITLPSKSASRSSAAQKQRATTPGKYSQQVILRSRAIQPLAVSKSVLIVTPDLDVTDIETLLDNFPGVEADVYPTADLASITLADLQGYDVVFTTNNTQWLAAGGVEPSVIGDLLADYVDGGGHVIINQFAYSYDAWQMTGRFITENYGPFTPSTTDEVLDVSLGDIAAPGHPLLSGVNTLDYTGYVQNVGLTPGATAVAYWDNGDLLVAANDNVVALNLLPTYGDGSGLSWSGDLPTLYQNAITYLAGPTFVDVTPKQGTVAPGAQLNLQVEFDATDLQAGVYTASINIHTNVPGQEVVAVPVTLTSAGPEFTVDPTSLEEELEREQTVTRTLTLKNNGPDNHTFLVSVSGLSASTDVVVQPAAAVARVEGQGKADKLKQASVSKQQPDRTGTQALTLAGAVAARSAAVGLASEQVYATDFESFTVGDIHNQQGWRAQFGNWTVEEANPSSGAKHLRGLADGLGQSLSISPNAGIGTEEKSTVAAKISIDGTGTSWQIIPQSPTAALVNTRIEFSADGAIYALTTGGYVQAAPSYTTGYFDVTIQVDRDSAYFDLYINDEKIFTGQGFTGNVEEVAILSFMETAGPVLDVDDLQIFDGEKVEAPTFITVSPVSGVIPAGGTATINVTFASDNLPYGEHTASITIAAGESRLVVPATLTIVGDPAIEVDPTVLQAVVDYRGDTTQYIHIANTGGNPLEYGLQVIGAVVEDDKAPVATKATRFKDRATDKRIVEKTARDKQSSRVEAKQQRNGITLLAGTALLEEHFEGASFPPSGWTVVDNAGTGVDWKFAADYGEGNYAGTGEAATVSSDAAGFVEFDTELLTPTIAVPGYKDIAVQYNVNYQNLLNLDFLDLDIQVDGGAWTNILHWNEDHGTLLDLPGEFVTVLLEDYLQNASSFRLRWHYYDPNTDDWDWYAQIDDVVILRDSRPWLTVAPAAGTIPVGEAVDVAAHFDGTAVGPGFYVAGILVTSNAPSDSLTGIVASLTVREPAEISVTPDSLVEELYVGEQATQTLTISNSGASTLRYAFGNTPLPARAPAAVKAITTGKEALQSLTASASDLRALSQGGPATKASIIQYSTGFEDFNIGTVNGQQGWISQRNVWNVSTGNAYEGTSHIHAEADGSGQVLAFSPEVAIGSDPISSTSVQLNFDNGAGTTWEVIPQSPTAEFVNTRFRVLSDGSVYALVNDGAGNGSFQPIATTLPAGYFELRIDIERATNNFTIYIDGTAVFSGLGFAGDIEQVVLLSLAETTGTSWDVDNIAIFDGPAETPWLTTSPTSGSVPPGSSATVTVTFNAEELTAGIYRDSLRLASNDPDNSPIFIPVELTVIQNVPPVLAPIDTAVVATLTSKDVTFTATDADDSVVTVQLLDAPSFVTLKSSGNGTATYTISPAVGQEGEYSLWVLATDARGASDSAIFHLSVVSYGVQSFSVINTRTGQVVTTFTDSLWLDASRPEFKLYALRANTNPATVGSVRFWDNNVTNEYKLDNSAPYDLFPLIFYLDGQQHSIKARAYARSGGRGYASPVKEVFLHLHNPTNVTDLDVVKNNGPKVSDLVDGSVIDISKPQNKGINIRANFSGPLPRSIVFTLNGAFFRVDNAEAFVLNGNYNGNGIDVPWPAAPGSYTLTATPYTNWNGLGVDGESVTVHFTIVNGTAPATASARGTSPETLAIVEETSAAGKWSVYPVPVEDVLSISLSAEIEGPVGLSILDPRGVAQFHEQGSADKFRDYSISTNKLGLTTGVYFIQIQYGVGKREIRKFIKQ
ncbi:S8 family serine peptidase [Fulvivirgaceae bacterium PWU5]|uniref:S8 family serine peptidase n=1 Tax=Dawidia cretensis TaxID=2782350 RepID=A0AAP2GU88_9BACT|nr:subtilase family N-terminal domain-containing protein [Dawidia cretensis]MBT1708525.1 S8 family serine peptidase [Dawidia cretensis]